LIWSTLAVTAGAVRCATNHEPNPPERNASTFQRRGATTERFWHAPMSRCVDFVVTGATITFAGCTGHENQSFTLENGFNRKM
jgi:hypothetical protein